MNIDKIRKDFPILSKKINGYNLIYFDTAATAQKPMRVLNDLVNFYTSHNSNIHRSVYSLGTEAEILYDKSKEVVKKFINANSSNEIIYTSGTTESLNLIARMLENELKENDEIIISSVEHHANFIPWQQLAIRKRLKLVIIEADNNGEFFAEQIKEKITNMTKIIALTQVSNTLGNIYPIEEIGDIIKDKDIFFVVDAAQSVPHFKVDVKKISCDFLAFSGHKICGPTGIGVLYAKKEILNKMIPAKFGGGMVGEVTDFNSDWSELQYKFEAGTPPIAQAVGLMGAIEYINEIGIENIEKYTNKLAKYLYTELKKIDGISIYGTNNFEKKVSIISFNIDGIHPHDLATYLDTKGICIRVGHQCTQPLLQRLKTFSVARISLYFYNTKDEVDFFTKTLKEAKEFFDNVFN